MAKTLLKFNQLKLNSDQFAVDGSAAGQINIKAGGIDTAELAADAVTGAKIADDSIDSEHYVDGSIDLAHLAADAVDGTKIADDSIDSEHYVDGSIDTAHIADDQVTAAKLDHVLTDNGGTAQAY